MNTENLETTADAKPTFASFDLPPVLHTALLKMAYTNPTPVQQEAIPLILAGHDVMASAQTGTGKTAAFGIPLVAKKIISSKDRVLLLTPTRELAEQIFTVLEKLCITSKTLKVASIIGGSSYYHQNKALRMNPTFVVGTPGRLIDHIEQGTLNLNNFTTLVLDEADRMLDMGFGPQLERILEDMPEERQTLLFSATFPKNIQKLASQYMKNPKHVSVGGESKPVDKIKQTVVNTTHAEKGDRLIEEIDKLEGSIIIFTKTKMGTEKLAKHLRVAGHEVGQIHGDRSQGQRKEALTGFRAGKFRILVATDVAARGIDVPHIQHVINFDLPLAPEDYIHRIGRTARAGAEGHAMAFVTPGERGIWARIWKMMYGVFPEGYRGGGRSGDGGHRFGSRSAGGGRGGGYAGGGERNYARGGRSEGAGFGGPRRDYAPRQDRERSFDRTDRPFVRADRPFVREDRPFVKADRPFVKKERQETFSSNEIIEGAERSFRDTPARKPAFKREGGGSSFEGSRSFREEKAQERPQRAGGFPKKSFFSDSPKPAPRREGGAPSSDRPFPRRRPTENRTRPFRD